MFLKVKINWVIHFKIKKKNLFNEKFDSFTSSQKFVLWNLNIVKQTVGGLLSNLIIHLQLVQKMVRY